MLHLAILGLATLGACSPFAAPQMLDLVEIAALAPAPKPTFAVGVLSQVLTYNPTSAASQVAAQVTADPISVDSAQATTTSVVSKRDVIEARTACGPQPTGAGPAASPDTVSAFLGLAAFSSAALNAPVPSGYVNTFTNLQASNNAQGYLGFTTMKTYDVQACASLCDAMNGCASINVLFERDPSVEPGPNCANPSSTTLIKCVFWGGPVTKDNAVNNGQYRQDFHVVIAGSNGYVNQTVDDCPGYTVPNYLGNAAINALTDCNNNFTYMGYKLFNDGKPFDTGRCAAACTAQTNYNLAYPPSDGTAPMLCQFFNTYILNNNSVPMGQHCALYSQTWAASYATNSGQWDQAGNHYTVSYSYMMANASYVSTC